mmetsp:Transcript_13433/g.29373  ORF Transcript_13433/g.29373 Transcript_13433/m.29373 type:complete len:106 (-) Transcript_13433:319-636(-)
MVRSFSKSDEWNGRRERHDQSSVDHLTRSTQISSRTTPSSQLLYFVVSKWQRVWGRFAVGASGKRLEGLRIGRQQVQTRIPKTSSSNKIALHRNPSRCPEHDKAE